MNKKIYITTYFPPIQSQQTAFCPNPFLQPSNQSVATISTTTAETALATSAHYQYPTNFNLFYPNNPHHQSYHPSFSQVNINNNNNQLYHLQYLQQQILAHNQVIMKFIAYLKRGKLWYLCVGKEKKDTKTYDFFYYYLLLSF